MDLFVLAILIEICSVMGLPWFVAATVLSINHVNSLKLESECAAPGEKPRFLGVREQRVTHILIFLMFGPTHTNVETHTYAGIIRRFSLYGSRFVERTSIFRQNFNYVDAG